MNAQMIRVLRAESPEIDTAFTHAEHVSKQRARIERGITKMRDKLAEWETMEMQAFHDAARMVSGG